MPTREESWIVPAVETTLTVPTLSDEAQAGLRLVVAHIIDTEGMQFEEKIGFADLDSSVKQRITPVVEGVCQEDSCQVEIEAEGFASGVDKRGSIVFTCFQRSFGSEAEAVADEEGRAKQCNDCHLQMRARLSEKLESLPAAVEESDQFIQEREQSLRTAKQARDNKLSLKD